MTQARKFPGRRLLAAGAAVLGGLLIVHAGLWFFATRRLSDELIAWQAQTRAAGWTVAAGNPVRAGWPLAAALSIPDVMLAADRAGTPSWQAAQVEVSVALFHPRQLRIRGAGRQVLRLPGLPEVGFTADRLVVTVPLEPGADQGDLAIAGLRAALPTGELRIPTLAAHAGFRPTSGSGEPAIAITASADAIALPPLPGGRSWPFGPHIASVSFDAALTGRLPPTASAPAAALTAAATAWRDGGGSLEVHRLALGWGQLGLSANGSLQLDEHLQPLGYATARLVGTDATLAALAASGLLAPRSVQAVKGVLTLLARVPEGGGAPQVDLPVLLQDRTVVVGGYPLVRVPEWQWP